MKVRRANKLFVIAVLSFCALFANADEKRYDVPINDSPRTGPDSAPVTIIEFLDFQ